jgi:hypothetical protein
MLQLCGYSYTSGFWEYRTEKLLLDFRFGHPDQ